MSADGLVLQAELDGQLDENAKAIEDMRSSGRECARAEARYRAAKAAKMLRLKADGFPASMTSDIAKGDQEVSAMFVAWKCAEADAKADQERVMLAKRRVDVLREQISRDWGQAR